MFFKKEIVKIIANRQKIVIGIIKISLVLAALGSIYEQNWLALFVSLLTLLLSFLPELFHLRYQIVLPRLLQFFVIIFVFAALFLGEARDFYIKYPWWDSLLHLSSGIALGFVGFLIIHILYKTEKFAASNFLLSALAFCFALALGTIWEIFEFAMDNIFSLNMQKARNLCEVGLLYCDSRLGLLDTMRDLILDAVGAFIASVSGYLYLSKKSPPFFHDLVEEFEDKNRHLFIKRKR